MSDAPIGLRFSQVYLSRGVPERDSQRFRRRLAGAYWDLFREQLDVVAMLKSEAGITVPYFGSSYNVGRFFERGELRDVLDAITLIHKAARNSERFSRGAKPWADFVARAFREENLGYRLDERCGVHYFVDEEFERGRQSTLVGLEHPKLKGALAAFEDAHRHLDAEPVDTKAAVRSMFEAVEIAARLIHPAKNLFRKLAEVQLKEAANVALGGDTTELTARGGMFDAMGAWVDAMHNYRHGQGVPDPVAPSLTFAVYALSTGSAHLRLLAEVIHKMP